MKQVCEYCGGYVSDTDEKCPHCMAANPGYLRQGDGVPKTIEELKQWYTAHNLPPYETTRFFIGINYKSPKAFGIYQEGSRFIVYKNKDNGQRAIRYEGSDEAYAVNELYLKLKERIAEEKAKNHQGSASGNNNSGKKKKNSMLPGIAIVAGIIAIGVVIGLNEPSRGYYNYRGNQYYYLGNDWYVYDTSYNSWIYTTVDEELSSNYSDYYESSSYDYSYGTTDFEDTEYYSDWQDSNWDSDSDWDSGDSWDSGGGDWGSDW